ncbi:putative integral membrane protein, Mpv17/pmp22 family protein [Rhizoctonia solani 123E]|uniref:Putative integral membrane protein, Mpv17/pmp22 family protein n=1 Tax=Rhizoctonia solani 123E TaxID=1423351 RepID=A0A074RIW5_9AGAM|nr:putative integral membrane protein, Mpv17/pmp22 family protein [Rhizoctonia solani 123E]
MQAYMRLMNRRPLLGPCITTAFLFGTGDIVAQQAVDRKGLKGHDWVRTARLSLYGGAIFAPIVVNWYKVRQNAIPRAVAVSGREGSAPRPPATLFLMPNRTNHIHFRVALDQFAFAPIAVGLFFTCTGLMEGKSIEQVKKKLDASYKETLIANWTLFIPFQTINMFIPLHHRLLAVNGISIPWNAFLSWKGATPAPKTLVAV